MTRLKALSLCILFVLFRQIVCAQERTLLAEGDSVALTATGAKPLSHWKLWRVDTGYEVIDSSAGNTFSSQIFRFDSEFMPIGFTKKDGPPDLPDSRIPKTAGGMIACEYKTKETVCQALSGDGAASKAAIATAAPYVVTGEFPDLDFLWLMTGVVHLASKHQSGGLVNVYALTSGKGPNEIRLKADKPIRIVSDGDGIATVLGREQPVKKYKWSSADGRLLLGTNHGLIVRIIIRPNTEFGYAVENYKEYAPWGVPF